MVLNWQPDPEMSVMDELFDRVIALNNLLKKIPLDVFRKEKAKNKGMNIFSTNHSYLFLNKLKRVEMSSYAMSLIISRLWDSF